MKQPKISNLKGVTQEMINELEVWLENVKRGKWSGKRVCPFWDIKQGKHPCYSLFTNLKYYNGHPCHIYGEEATILAFTIICDVWRSDNDKPR